jgi:hypothetical protein
LTGAGRSRAAAAAKLRNEQWPVDADAQQCAGDQGGDDRPENGALMILKRAGFGVGFALGVHFRAAGQLSRGEERMSCSARDRFQGKPDSAVLAQSGRRTPD